MLNRSVIDLLGYEPWVIGFSRNNMERIEKALDGLAWFTIGLGLPLLIQKPLSGLYERFLKNRFDLNPEARLLETPFAQLANENREPSHPKGKALASHFGLKDASKVGALAKWVSRFKLAIVAVDLFFMAAKGSIYFWGRNELTEKLSDKKGFFGEMTTATTAQLKDNVKDYESAKSFNQLLTGVFSVLGVIGLPLMLGVLLKNSAKVGSGVVGKMKKLLPAFDYHNKIYMSKWVMFWSNLFTWNLTGYLAARTPNEKREHIVKSIIMDSMMFVGDSVIAGTAGWWMGRHKKVKQVLGDLKLFKRGVWGIPVERSIIEIQKEAAKISDDALKVADKLARRNFRTGLVGTSLVLGIGTTLANNHYTKLKLISQQRKMAEQWSYRFTEPLHLRYPKKPLFEHLLLTAEQYT